MYSHDQPQPFLGSVLLLVTAVIWGCAFVAQSVAMDFVKPFTFCAARFVLSGTALVPFLLIRKRMGFDDGCSIRSGRGRARFRTALTGGMICGCFLFLGSILQQIGIQYTTTGKAGFLTALYIILVPIYSTFLGKKPKPTVAAAAGIALVGMYLLCMEESLRLSKGDMFCLFCACAFPFQILSVDHFASRTDAVLLSCVEFFTVSVIAFVLAMIFDHPDPAALKAALLPVLYAGLLSGAVAYTLQAVGQKKMQNPSAASLIMSLESVFAALAGWILLDQVMSARKIIGCIIMFAAIVLAQL
ncbi:MAG: DMT family transporter [Stomatobaculum sp.]|nr:DMT family transporter [Stomatobaculum sp.]